MLEDGVPQTISNFSQSSDAPIVAVMLVEFAANNYNFIYDMLNNAYGFASSLKPNDWVSVISYDMRPEVQQDFTQNKQAVIQALNHLRIPGFRETNEFDALYDTLDRLERVEGHKYIILISSGVDTFSRLNFDKVLKKIKASHDVTIFPISTGFLFRELADPYLNPSDVMPGTTDRLDYLQADNEMKTFAQLTGGKAYFPRFTGNVPEVVADISADMALRSSVTRWLGSNAARSASSAASTSGFEYSRRFVTPVWKYWSRYSSGSMTLPRAKM